MPCARMAGVPVKGHDMDNELHESLASLQESTGRLVTAAAALDDAAMGAPSRLPGWTRGHVLTHLARNADGLANLLRWARTGIETPMYASAQARDADIEAGAGRPAAELAADVAASAAAFAAEAAGLPAEAWTAQVRLLRGPALPVRRVPAIRLFEVEVHHVDLGTGYRPGDWPDGFAAGNLPRVARDFAGREDTPACRLQPDGGDSWLHIGPGEPATAAAIVHGTPAGLLAWLLGRDDGKGLRVSGDDATLPELPRWR
jgi:maleylpyruvate isomerase